MLLPNARKARIVNVKNGRGVFMEGNDWVTSSFVEVSLDRGIRAGIRPGWLGFLTDTAGRLVPGGRFEIHSRGPDSSYGRVRLPMVQVQGCDRTVLVDPRGFPRRREAVDARLVTFKVGGPDHLVAALNRGTWGHAIDSRWKVEGRRTAGERPERFEILRVSQTGTVFRAPLHVDEIRAYRHWRIVP
ncbi:MAG TPA: hypothetical protein VKU85_03445 [bacterium]|nr:hypothetical protein [bacterium]